MAYTPNHFQGNTQTRNNSSFQGGLNELHAAYNFVPLADWVNFCPWAEQLSHDHPFADGISGSVDFSLSNHTRLLVGGSHDAKAPVRFFRMPGNNGQEGKYAIPGTAVRGMVRSVLEIAAFGKFHLVDDARLGVRDLASAVKNVYQKSFAGEVEGAYKALSRSAWLWFRDGKWLIETCAHARVEHFIIDRYAGVRWAPTARGANKGWRPSAIEKYQELAKRGASLDVRFKAGKETNHPHSAGKFLRYAKCDALSGNQGADILSGPGVFQGRLVVTGQPGPGKHMEFVFSAPTGKPEKLLPANEGLISQFLEINGESDEWQKHWRPKAINGEPVPIFYLRQNPDENTTPLRAIGLSQMFKLPYTLSVHDAICNSDDGHLETVRPDFVEGIFGYLDDENGSLRSRVSFSVAQAQGVPKEAPAVRIVLNGPKPSYFPSYIVQGQSQGQLKNGQYTTLMNEDAKLRGWKRYPVKDGFEPEPAAADQDGVASTLQPLEPGAVFEGKMRFHNLRPAELGALLWALTWGNDNSKRHAMGMGKPCGFGQVSIDIGPTRFIQNDSHPAPAPDSLLDAFKAHMENAAKTAKKSGWQNSEQLRELLAMADPSRSLGKDLRHMQLKNPMGKNEFVLAKGNRRDNQPALALPAFTALGRRN